jgi:preprotein translocase subunit SecE
MNPLLKILKFFKESKSELKKVKWPTFKETLQYTLIVIIISLVVAAYLGGLDYIFSLLLRKFIIK